MFKRAVITDEISQDVETAVALAQRFGLDAVELRSIYEHGAFAWTREDVERVKSALRGTGLGVCGIGAPFYKCDIDNAQERKEHMDGLRRCIDYAQELGTTLIRGFTFWQKGDFATQLDRIAQAMQEPAELLRKAGMTLVLESDPSVNATNAAKLMQVVSKVDHPNVRALWDPGNDIYDPDGEVPYPDGYHILRPYIAHVHVKDARLVDGKPEGTPIGQGAVDWRGQFGALLADGYTGYVVLETHYRHKHELSEEILALPQGSAFSQGGYEATEESLLLWQRMLDELRA